MTAAELISKYGPVNDDYFHNHCMVWFIQQDFPWFPAKRIFINKDFKVLLQQSLSAVQTAGLHGEIKVLNGCYVNRPVRGSNAISAHAYACAVDLNASEEPMVVKDFNAITPEDRQGKWSKEFIAAMISSGIYYGGNFQHRPDPMHFSYADM